MKHALALALVLASGLAAAAEPNDLKPQTRIQRRYVEKKGRFAAYAGFAWLGRGDYYRSPGVEVAASYYVLEPLAIDLRGAWFFSYNSEELDEIVRRTSFLPDSHRSLASVLAGLRWSVGYAKIRITDKIVVHFEPQLFFYGGIHVTGSDIDPTKVAPMFEIGLGFLVAITRHIEARIDAGLTVGGEQRTNYVAVVGGFPVVSVGVLF